MTLDVTGLEVTGGARGKVNSLNLPRSAPDLTSDSYSSDHSTSPSPGKSRKNSMMIHGHHSRSPPSGWTLGAGGGVSMVVGGRRDCSPHHTRSQSVRTVKRPNRLELPEFRSRVSSMPIESARYNPRLLDDDDFYRLRSFSITAKGIVNRGDSLRSRRSRSNNSVASSRSGHSGEPRDGVSSANNSRASTANSYASSQDEVPGNEKYRVVMLGAAGVGKTALTTQFMTSEYMNAYDASLDDDFGEKSVSVLLDGEESEMMFIDHPSHEMSVENCIATYEPHAYVIVYSITDRLSFQTAEDILAYLWRGDYMRNKAVILVGNKTDLVRARVVSTEDGKSLATSHESKFIETSSGINHNVDELLVGILSQIRLKLRRSSTDMTETTKKDKKKNKYKGSRTVSLRAKGLLNKLCRRDTKSKSCENLHVL